MTDTKAQTPAEQFRDTVTEILKDKSLKQADRIAAIVAEFKEWIEAHQSGTTVELVGGRVVVQTIEVHGLRIGLDAIGNATEVEAPAGAEFTWST
jgi:hypothetical protein